jgi:23S rRNA pseudouridine955/2504/2580 synthase
LKKPDFASLIIFENDNYLAVNKPTGISVLDDRSIPPVKSMLDLAKEYQATAQACHRIDKETSGVLVFSKHPDAYRNLAIQFENREVMKFYHALVHGVHEFKEETFELPLTFSGGMAKVEPGGKFAATIVETLGIFGPFSLLLCMPLTGRTHQIRVHLAYKGAPIVGDEKYGGKPFFLSEVKKKYHSGKDKEEKPLLNRAALHAFSIQFRDLNEEIIKIEADYPKDLSASVNQLNRLK